MYSTLYFLIVRSIRMGMVVRPCRNMGHGDWPALLGNSWTCCYNIREYGCYLRRILGTAGPLLPMMTIEEQVAFAASPYHLIVYHGCFSFTIHRRPLRRDGADRNLRPNRPRSLL
jgi:hypothetical protein